MPRKRGRNVLDQIKPVVEKKKKKNCYTSGDAGFVVCKCGLPRCFWEWEP